ncbi:MAG TPA: hypothetical protein VJV78_21495 [Polyangiales bacterium]|nr:hypothetical protein [Polyangiales bacterium]
MKIGLAIVLTLSAASVRADDGAERLRHLRLDGAEVRHTEGIWLFAWGAANAVAGGTILAVGHDDERWLGAGIAAAGFGVVNALLAFGLLDLSGDKRRAALSLDATDPRTLERLREEQLAFELQTGQFYAVNFGLDVAYVTAGIFMYSLGREMDPEVEWLQGAGLCVIGQGAFLLAFDLIAWIGANRRANAFRIEF